MQRDRSPLAVVDGGAGIRARRAILGQDVGQALAQLIEAEQRAGVAAQQQRQVDPLDPRLVQELLGIEAGEQGMRAEEADQCPGGGAADRVDRRLLLLLAVEVADRVRKPGGRARLVGAQRGPSGEGEIEAKRRDGRRSATRPVARLSTDYRTTQVSLTPPP